MLEDNSIERVVYHLGEWLNRMGAFLNPALHGDIIEVEDDYSHLSRDAGSRTQMLALYFEVLIPASLQAAEIQVIMDAVAESEQITLELQNGQVTQLSYFLLNPQLYVSEDKGETYSIRTDPTVPSVISGPSQARLFPHQPPAKEVLKESKADGILTAETFNQDWSSTLSFPIMAAIGGFVLEDEMEYQRQVLRSLT